MGVLTRYSSELDEDSVINLADDLAMDMGKAFAYKEDAVGFNGTGISTDGGITGLTVKVNDGNHDEALYTAATGNTAFSTLDLADFEGMAGQLPEFAEQADPAWYFSKKGYWASIARLVDAGGGNTIQDLGRGPERVFLGYPIRVSQVLNNTLTAQTSTIVGLLGDLSLSSAIRDRRGLRVMISEDRYFEQDQLAIKGTMRVGINNHTLTIIGEDNSTTESGPVVALKTPAS